MIPRITQDDSKHMTQDDSKNNTGWFQAHDTDSTSSQASLWGDEIKLDNMYKNSLGGAHRITEFTKQHNESV